MTTRVRLTWAELRKRVRAVTPATKEKEIENILLMIVSRAAQRDRAPKEYGENWAWVAVDVARRWRDGQ
jgi:hypothetical protein